MGGEVRLVMAMIVAVLALGGCGGEELTVNEDGRTELTVWPGETPFMFPRSLDDIDEELGDIKPDSEMLLRLMFDESTDGVTLYFRVDVKEGQMRLSGDGGEISFQPDGKGTILVDSGEHEFVYLGRPKAQFVRLTVGSASGPGDGPPRAFLVPNSVESVDGERLDFLNDQRLPLKVTSVDGAYSVEVLIETSPDFVGESRGWAVERPK